MLAAPPRYASRFGFLTRREYDERAEAVDHHPLDDLLQLIALVVAVVDELDPHPGLVPLGDLRRQRLRLP